MAVTTNNNNNNTIFLSMKSRDRTKVGHDKTNLKFFFANIYHLSIYLVWIYNEIILRN